MGACYESPAFMLEDVRWVIANRWGLREAPDDPLQRAYQLAMSLCDDHAFVCGSLLPAAVASARELQKKMVNRWSKGPKSQRVKPLLAADQLLQFGVLFNLDRADRLCQSRVGWYLVRYLASLVTHCTSLGKAWTAAGLGGVLRNIGWPEVAGLNDRITPISKLVEDFSTKGAEVKGTLGDALEALVQTEPKGTSRRPILSTQTGVSSEAIVTLLERMIPWSTGEPPGFPRSDQYNEWLAEKRDLDEDVPADGSSHVRVAHIWIHECCFQEVRGGGQVTTWMLPRPKVGTIDPNWRPLPIPTATVSHYGLLGRICLYGYQGLLAQPSRSVARR